MQKLYCLVSRKLYWAFFAVTGAAMLFVALYYQHALGDDPCEVCIHARIWVTGFTLLAILMLALPSRKLILVIGNLTNTAMAVGLLERSLYLRKVEKGFGDSSCSFYLNFPEWFALDKWIPEIYEVRNLCSYSPELMWGITMTEGLICIATALIVCSISALVSTIFYGPQKS